MQSTTFPRVLPASTLREDEVIDPRGETLGHIEDIMVDVASGRVAYAVLSFGGSLGSGDNLFAIPWSALELDRENHAFVLDEDAERLEQAQGFDEDSWPDFTEEDFHTRTCRHWGQREFWTNGAPGQDGGRAAAPYGSTREQARAAVPCGSRTARGTP